MDSLGIQTKAASNDYRKNFDKIKWNSNVKKVQKTQKSML
jgi:hypothetical protein